MQLNPRYGDDPIIELRFPPAEILEPLVRQRGRLADCLSSFTDEQWMTPSRCAGWSNRDVIVHLESTNGFWSHSIAEGVRGAPTRFLATFDPVATPAQMVASSQDEGVDELVDRFVASNRSLAELCASLGPADWEATAEAPPGHVSVSAVAHHALWDSWVHERDVLLPVGIEPDQQADELAACLRYAASLGPALALTVGAETVASIQVHATDPETRFSVTIGEHVVVAPTTSDSDLRMTGGAVELIEALSMRTPLPQSVPHELHWLRSGIAQVFDLDAR